MKFFKPITFSHLLIKYFFYKIKKNNSEFSDFVKTI